MAHNGSTAERRVQPRALMEMQGTRDAVRNSRNRITKQASQQPQLVDAAVNHHAPSAGKGLGRGHGKGWAQMAADQHLSSVHEW